MNQIFKILLLIFFIAGCDNKKTLEYSPFFQEESSKLLSIRHDLRIDGDIRSGLKGVFINFPLHTDDENSENNLNVGVLVDIVLEKDKVSEILCSIGENYFKPTHIEISKTIGNLSMCSLGYAINVEVFLSGELQLGTNDSMQTIIDSSLLNQWKTIVYNNTTGLDDSQIKDSILSAWFVPTELVVRQLTPNEWKSMQ